MYHWSIVLLAAICIVIMAKVSFVLSRTGQKTIKVMKPMKIRKIHFGFIERIYSFVLRKPAYLKEKFMKIGWSRDTHRDFSKSMAKAAVSGVIRMS